MLVLFALTQFERPEWCVRLTNISDSEETKDLNYYIKPRDNETDLAKDFLLNCTNKKNEFSNFGFIYVNRVTS